MIKIKMSADKPFYNNVDVKIFDFPNGIDEEPRKRCTITVEFAEADVENLKRRGMSFDEAIKYYEEWIDSTLKRYLSQEWECLSGYEAVIDIVKEKVARFY